MSEIPLGLSFNEEDEIFVLRRKERDGTVVALTISAAELDELSGTIASWKDRRSSEILDRSGQVQQVVLHLVAGVGFSQETLGERLLLTLIGASGYRRPHGLPPHLIDALVEQMPLFAAEMRYAKLAEQ